ncbi:MAG: hypothetical protein EZS28_046846, partial [Streblomastix strix]
MVISVIRETKENNFLNGFSNKGNLQMLQQRKLFKAGLRHDDDIGNKLSNSKSYGQVE